MAIEFHCEHCGKIIKAPPETAGRRGKCPHCQGVCYIPAAPDEADPYDLTPEDPEAERRRAREEAAAHEIQRKLLHERAEPGGPDKPESHKDDETVRPGDLRAVLADYLNAMGKGQLQQAEQLQTLLSRNRKEALALIDRVGSDDVAAAELTKLPRPVLLGFLRQLRTKL